MLNGLLIRLSGAFSLVFSFPSCVVNDTPRRETLCFPSLSSSRGVSRVTPARGRVDRLVASSSNYVCEVEEGNRTIIKGPFNYSVPARPVLNPPRMGPLWSPAEAVRFEWVSRAAGRRRMMKTRGSKRSERRFGTRFLVDG
ncbi:hypothetical protein MRX96_054632 [Rhipicephalus microplus]